MTFTPSRRLAAELLGTALLLATIVGSGIMAERLAGGNQALALLCNTIPTGALLAVLILVFQPISGAHFNPVVTLVLVTRRILPFPLGLAYIGAQVIGGILGVLLAHAMFDSPLWQFGIHQRTGLGQWLAEAVATAGLILVILGCGKSRAHAIPYAVGGYITAAYWFTASTSFANPAVTIARAFTASFAGIRPEDIIPFVLSQFIGAALGLLIWRWFEKSPAISLEPASLEPARSK